MDSGEETKRPTISVEENHTHVGDSTLKEQLTTT